MASAWGTSFGTAWANSWEARTPTAAPAPTPAQVGGVSRRRGRTRAYARREYVIGDKRYVFIGDGEIERMLVERIGAPVRVARVPRSAPAIPVNVEPSSPIEEWGPADIPLTVDVRAVQQLRQQSQRLGQHEVIDALDRVIARIKRIRREIEEDDAEIEMLLMHL